MPDGAQFQYAILRVVPDVERGERLNAGIVLLCRPQRFLAARIELDERLLLGMAPAADLARIRAHLDLIPRLCAGDADAGPLALLDQPERFHWIASPSSTVVQPSAVHTGLTADATTTLDGLMARLVERDPPGRARRDGKLDT
jgi:Protein of unknown function (DUF3037)